MDNELRIRHARNMQPASPLDYTRHPTEKQWADYEKAMKKWKDWVWEEEHRGEIEKYQAEPNDEGVWVTEPGWIGQRWRLATRAEADDIRERQARAEEESEEQKRNEFMKQNPYKNNKIGAVLYEVGKYSADDAQIRTMTNQEVIRHNINPSNVDDWNNQQYSIAKGHRAGRDENYLPGARRHASPARRHASPARRHASPARAPQTVTRGADGSRFIREPETEYQASVKDALSKIRSAKPKTGKVEPDGFMEFIDPRGGTFWQKPESLAAQEADERGIMGSLVDRFSNVSIANPVEQVTSGLSRLGLSGLNPFGSGKKYRQKRVNKSRRVSNRTRRNKSIRRRKNKSIRRRRNKSIRRRKN
jgi:hypothetical protein